MMTNKKELESKIDELEGKLAKLAEQLDEDKPEKVYVIGTNPVGEDRKDIIKRIAVAKEEVEPHAGLVKNTQDGSILTEDKPQDVRIPSGSIHFFSNMEECECDCHPMKNDCMNCYDHPEHLEGKRKMREVQVEDIEEIPKKKSRWSWFKK